MGIKEGPFMRIRSVIPDHVMFIRADNRLYLDLVGDNFEKYLAFVFTSNANAVIFDYDNCPDGTFLTNRNGEKEIPDSILSDNQIIAGPYEISDLGSRENMEFHVQQEKLGDKCCPRTFDGVNRLIIEIRNSDGVLVDKIKMHEQTLNLWNGSVYYFACGEISIYENRKARLASIWALKRDET